MRWERSVVTKAKEQEVGDAQEKWRSSNREGAQQGGERPDSPAEAPRNPSKKLQSFPARLVAAGVNDQALKTILWAVMEHIMFPFIRWKAGLWKEAGKVLIKDPLR